MPGTELASCSGDKTVRLWREDPSAASWQCVAILEDVHSRTIRSVAWSPDGRLLATASFDRTVAVWEKTSDPGRGGTEARLVWELAATLEGHESEVKGVAWSSDGIHLATCSRDKTVWVWEWAPGNDFEVVDVKQGHSQVGFEGWGWSWLAMFGGGPELRLGLCRYNSIATQTIFPGR